MAIATNFTADGEWSSSTPPRFLKKIFVFVYLVRKALRVNDYGSFFLDKIVSSSPPLKIACSEKCFAKSIFIFQYREKDVSFAYENFN